MTNWNERIDSLTNDYQENFGDLTSEMLNWKPDASTWSIAQVIHHLIVINESYYPIFDKVLDGTYQAPFHSRFNFLVKFFGKTILNSVNPDNKRKAKTFTIWQPASSDQPEDIVERFVQHQTKLKDYVTRLQPYMSTHTVINSPANRNIVYSINTAIEIIVTHEFRHLGQARDLLPLTREAFQQA